MDDAFVFERSARSPRALTMIGAAVVAILVMIFAIGAAIWITAIFAIFTLPAIYEAVTGARSRLRLDEETLEWQSGTRGQSFPIAQIEELTLATTLDFSQRATVRLTDGRKIRIPPDCLPGGKTLDAELSARDIPHRRSLFGF